MKHFLFYGALLTICSSFQTHWSDNRELSLKAVIDSRSGNNLLIKVILLNNSADTIKYMGMDCSWQDSYLIDNDRWSIFVNVCFKNGPHIYSIPPYQSETKILRLERALGSAKSRSSIFKIGFRFVPPPVPLKQIPIKLEKLKSNAVTIWSNEVWTSFSR